jgi:glycosyltransferase involved in cell wall biosynthesis
MIKIADSNPGGGDQELVCLVVPVFNERTMLPIFFEAVLPVLDSLDIRYQIIIVDDGSADGSAEFVRKLIKINPCIKLIKLSRNFGKEAALTAGLENAQGDAVIVMDVDLQDPPELIPEMVQRWRLGSDVVLMKRRSRKGESFGKRWSAKLFYRMLDKTSHTQIPIDTGDFRLMSRKAVLALRRLNERNRYMKGLFAWIGMPTTTIEYDRAVRAAGTSKWDYPGLVGLALEGLTSFSTVPLRWATLAGLLAASVGGFFGVWIVIKALLLGDPTSGYPSLIAMICFLGGIQLVSVGIVGEYVGKTYIETKQRPIYMTEEVVENGAAFDTTTKRETPGVHSADAF